MKKKELLKNKKIVIPTIIVIVILLLFVSLNLSRNLYPGEDILKDITISIEKVVMYPFTSLNKDKGIDQSKSYLIQKNVNSSLEKEIEELKDTLELNKSLTEYDVVNATVLSRNKSYWFNTLTVDKGKKQGLKKNMAVVTKHGLVGKISKVSNNSSEVKLITSDDLNFKVSVSIKTNDTDNYAILNGYDKNTKLIKVSGIDKTTEINEGDTVVTSGLGEMFPAGIYIGDVKKVESDKYNLSKNIYVETKQNFRNIHYVTVLKVK